MYIHFFLQTPECHYKRRADFVTDEDYNEYMKLHLRRGQRVKCCSDTLVHKDIRVGYWGTVKTDVFKSSFGLDCVKVKFDKGTQNMYTMWCWQLEVVSNPVYVWMWECWNCVHQHLVGARQDADDWVIVDRDMSD